MSVFELLRRNGGTATDELFLTTVFWKTRNDDKFGEKENGKMARNNLINFFKSI